MRLWRHATWFREAWQKSGKKLDMGKACIRFKKLDDMALDVIAEAIRRVPARKYIEYCEAARTSQSAKTKPRYAKKSGPARGKKAK